MAEIFIGVDVGSTSARAGLFDRSGKLIASARHPLITWRDGADIVEQSSDDIWQACARAVRAAIAASGVSPADIGGIGFDATCSLVALAPDATPVTVSESGESGRNVIVWMDHRATPEAADINATGHAVLAYVGGVISPEMQTPKLLWLKRHLPERFAAAGHFFDLPDYLTFRATGSTARSICTVTCKWTYLGHERRWDADYFRTIGLGELADEGFVRIGTDIVDPGTPLGHGLTAAAARDLGLAEGTPVGAALIDAHAGGVGTVGARPDGDDGPADPARRLAYILGTSACIMATAPGPVFVPGVWGPYFSAMIPGLWLNEGGQSAAGAGTDRLVEMHPAYGEAAAAAGSDGIGVLELLERNAVARAGGLSDAALLARDIHVLPEFLGNRSPHADPGMRAIVAGLDLDRSRAGLESLYVAGLCGLAYGLAEVIEAMRQAGLEADMLLISGGAARSALVRQVLADAVGLPVALPENEEPVLLGAAMLAAVASGAYGSLEEAMGAMARIRSTVAPSGDRLAQFHAAKRNVYRRLQAFDREARAEMSEAGLQVSQKVP